MVIVLIDFFRKERGKSLRVELLVEWIQ